MSQQGISGVSPELGSSVADVLAQMRAMQAQATGRPDALALQQLDRASQVAPSGAPGFSELLRNAVDGVNELQQSSAALSAGFVRGEHDDLVASSIASQKSSLAFQAVVTARNRMVSAYQDIMNMPI